MKRGGPIKRGKPLQAKKALQRGGPIKRKKAPEICPECDRSKPKKPKRRRRVYPPGVYGPLHRFTKTLPCLLIGRVPGHVCIGSVSSHHVKTVGSGGVDLYNTANICEGFHREGHSIGWETWQAKYRVDLPAEARRVTLRWIAEGMPDPRQRKRKAA